MKPTLKMNPTLKILFADDDLKYALLLKDFLTRNGYDVTYAGNGRIALDLFEEIKPGTFKMFPVILGNSENGYTELTGFDGNKASKKFVTEGAYQLLMALKNVEE